MFWTKKPVPISIARKQAMKFRWHLYLLKPPWHWKNLHRLCNNRSVIHYKLVLTSSNPEGQCQRHRSATPTTCNHRQRTCCLERSFYGRLRSDCRSIWPRNESVLPSLRFHHARLGFRQPAKKDSVLCELCPETKAELPRVFPNFMAKSILSWMVGLEHRQRPASIKQKKHSSTNHVPMV